MFYPWRPQDNAVHRHILFLSVDSDDNDGSAEASFLVCNCEHEALALLQIQRDVVRFRCLLWTGKVVRPVCLEGCTDLIKTHLLHSMKGFQVSYCVNNAMFLQFDQRHDHEIRMKQKGTTNELECGQERVIIYPWGSSWYLYRIRYENSRWSLFYFLYVIKCND